MVWHCHHRSVCPRTGQGAPFLPASPLGFQNKSPTHHRTCTVSMALTHSWDPPTWHGEKRSRRGEGRGELGVCPAYLSSPSPALGVLSAGHPQFLTPLNGAPYDGCVDFLRSLLHLCGPTAALHAPGASLLSEYNSQELSGSMSVLSCSSGPLTGRTSPGPPRTVPVCRSESARSDGARSVPVRSCGSEHAAF